jgi:general stress protein 26
MENTDDLKKMHALIRGVKMAMLTTIDERGGLHSRPMTTLQVDEGRDLWFFTRTDSGKVADVAHDMQVNLAYADPGDNRYVSVSGIAQLVRDRVKIKELWQPGYSAFFPEGVDDPHLALLRVSAHDVEYWTGPTNFLGKLIRFAAAVVKKDPGPLGENEKLTLV